MPEAQKNYSLPKMQFTDVQLFVKMQDMKFVEKKCERSLVLSCKLSLQRKDGSEAKVGERLERKNFFLLR